MNSSPVPRVVRRPARLRPCRVVPSCSRRVPPLWMQRPLFLEGEAGVGKTEIPRGLAPALGTARFVRRTCPLRGGDVVRQPGGEHRAGGERDPGGSGLPARPDDLPDSPKSERIEVG